MKKYLNDRTIRIALIISIILGYCILCIPNWKVSYKNSTVKTGSSVDGVPLLNGHIIEQPVVFEKDTIKSIGIVLNAIEKNATGNLEYSLLNEQEEVLYTAAQPIESFENNHVKWLRINWNVVPMQQYTLRYTINDLEGEASLAVVSEEKATDECISGCFYDKGASDGRVVVDISYEIRIEKRDRLRFAVYAIILILIVWFYKKAIEKRFFVISGVIALVILDIHYTSVLKLDNVINRNLFLTIAGIFVIGASVQVAMYLKGERRHERFFVVLMLMWGVIYTLTLPPLMAPDEPTHYVQAYKISNVILGTRVEDEAADAVIRNTDGLDYDRDTFGGYIQEFYGKINEKNSGKEEYVSFEATPNRMLAPVYNYIPQGIGISIARICHLNYFWLIYLGRLFNLLTFTIIMYYAIKITPVGKLFLLNMSQIPILVENVSSYSYDVLVISMCALFVANVLKILYQENKMGKKDVAILLILGGIIATLKYLYTPIIFLVFCIPKEKFGWDKVKRSMFKGSIVLVACIMYLSVYNFGILSMSTIYKWDRSVSNSIEENNIAIEKNDTDNSEIVAEEVLDFEGQEVENEEDDGHLVDEGEYPAYNLAYFKENSFRACEKIGYTLGKYLEDDFANAFGRLLARHNVFTPEYAFTFYFIWFMITLLCEDKSKINPSISYMSLGVFLLFCVGIMTGALVAMGKPDDFKYVYGVQGRYFIPLFPLFILIVRKTRFFMKDYMERYLVLTNIVQLLSVMFMCLYIWEK